jgi:hypothetical protein
MRIEPESGEHVSLGYSTPAPPLNGKTRRDTNWLMKENQKTKKKLSERLYTRVSNAFVCV